MVAVGGLNECVELLQFLGTAMACTDRSPSPTVPTSGENGSVIELTLLRFQCDVAECLLLLAVHKLRPGDIKVVAAVGDSITVSHRGSKPNQARKKEKKQGSRSKT